MIHPEWQRIPDIIDSWSSKPLPHERPFGWGRFPTASSWFFLVCIGQYSQKDKILYKKIPITAYVNVDIGRKKDYWRLTPR
jgi:hypothetical protein